MPLGDPADAADVGEEEVPLVVVPEVPLDWEWPFTALEKIETSKFRLAMCPFSGNQVNTAARRRKNEQL